MSDDKVVRVLAGIQRLSPSQARELIRNTRGALQPALSGKLGPEVQDFIRELLAIIRRRAEGELR